MRFIFATLWILLLSLISGCGGSQTNIFVSDYNPATEMSLISSHRYYDDNRKFFLQGSIVGGDEILTVAYTSNNWVFFKSVTMRFSHSSKKYKIPFSDSTKQVLEDSGKIIEAKFLKTNSAKVGEIVSIMKKRSTEGLDTTIYISGGGGNYADTGTILIKAGDYSLPGFFIHRGDPKGAVN